MLSKMRKTNNKGFTLIELMIVIAIIGILAAIAIPNFIAYRNKSFCSATESDANNIASAVSDYFAIPANVSISIAALGGANAAGKVYVAPLLSNQNTWTVAAAAPNTAITVTVVRVVSLIFLTGILLLALTFGSLGTDLFVILLQGSEILTSLRELALLHALTDVPVDEGTLGVHQVELVVNARESLGNGGGVGHHAHSSLHTSQVASWNDGGGLVVDAALESSGAPVHELNGSLGLDGGHRGIHILGDHISAVHQAASHVLAVARVALGHHVGGLEDRVCDLGNGQLLVVGLLSRDDGGVGGEHEVDARVGHQVGLELRDIDVESTIETKGGSQRGHDLGDQTIQVGVGRSLDIQVTTAHIVQGLVIETEGAIGVLEEGVGGEDVVVWFHHGSGHLGSGSDGEGQLGLATIVNRQSLEEKRSKTRSSTSTSGVEDHETLETGTVVGQLTNTIENKINNLLTDGVVTSGIVVGSIFLAGNHLLRMVELTVGSSANFVTNTWLQIHKDGTRNMLTSTSLREKGVERIISSTNSLVRGHLSIRLDSVFKAIKFPASVSSLDTSLTDMNRKAFTHCC
mgnify:CR=1 FL=1